MENTKTSSAICRTCGSEIVRTINDSNFNEGECGACEYERYSSQPALLAAAFRSYCALCDLGYHLCFRWRPGRFREANEAIGALGDAINAYGKEA